MPTSLVNRRFALAIMSGGAILASGPGRTQQPDYPNRPIKLVVPFPAGGPTDVAARIIISDLSMALGQNVVIENKGGAGGNIAAADVAKAVPDGYTLLEATAGTHGINAALYKAMPYDHLRDFVPVALLASSPNLFLVHPSVPATTIGEFVALAKEKKGGLQIAIAGYGTTPHMAAELLKVSAGIEFTLVPYKGGGQAMTDLIGGHITAMVDNVPTALPHIRSGAIRALAVSSFVRSSVLPDVPTVSETLPGFECFAWWGIAAPTGTPAPVVARLNGEINRLLATDAIRRRYDDLGAEPQPRSVAAFDALIRSETEKWARVVAATGAKIQ